jgi:hypothetical protein
VQREIQFALKLQGYTCANFCAKTFSNYTQFSNSARAINGADFVFKRVEVADVA